MIKILLNTASIERRDAAAKGLAADEKAEEADSQPARRESRREARRKNRREWQAGRRARPKPQALPKMASMSAWERALDGSCGPLSSASSPVRPSPSAAAASPAAASRLPKALTRSPTFVSISLSVRTTLVM